MSAALPIRVEPLPSCQWDPADCRALWLAALELYLRDAEAGSRGGQLAHARDALDDLLGPRAMLTRLCEPIDLSVDAVARAMLARLT